MTTPRPPATGPFLRDLAAHLVNLDLVRWNPNGAAYTGPTTLPALFFETLPPQPDHAISLASYNDDRSRDRDSPDFYIQLRGRAPGRDPLATHALMDRIFEALDDEEKPPTPPTSCGGQQRYCSAYATSADLYSRTATTGSADLTVTPSPSTPHRRHTP